MLKEPTDVKEIYYYTDRDIGKGSARAWAFKLKCPKCGAPMQKPRNKQGKPIKKADYYECPECGYKLNAKDYESKLTLNIQYVCPYCGHKGEAQIPFKRKKVSFKVFDEVKRKDVRKTVDAFVFKCEKCGRDIYITKKLKEVKK